MPNVSDERISLIRNSRKPRVGVSLCKRRTWYADDDRDDQGEQGEGDDSSPATMEDAKRLIAALKKRVGDKEREKDEAVGSIKRQLDAIENDRKKKLAEEGNFKTLAEQAQAEAESLRGYKDRVGALEQVIRDSNEGRIKSLPESVRELVPVDYAPEKLQAWLNKNESLLKKPAPPNFDGGAGAGGGSGGRGSEIKVTDDDKRQAEIAASQGYNIKPEDIAKRREAMKADKPGANE